MEISIVKYGNHPSIVSLAKKMEKLGDATFAFDFTYEDTVKEVKNLQIRKVYQKTDIPGKFSRKMYILFLISCIIILITRCNVLHFPLAGIRRSNIYSYKRMIKLTKKVIVQ